MFARPRLLAYHQREITYIFRSTLCCCCCCCCRYLTRLINHSNTKVQFRMLDNIHSIQRCTAVALCSVLCTPMKFIHNIGYFSTILTYDPSFFFGGCCIARSTAYAVCNNQVLVVVLAKRKRRPTCLLKKANAYYHISGADFVFEMIHP